jgi:hypothetical protein
LKEAGLNRIHIHVDARQGRTGWQGKDEAALNELRQHYADLIHRVKGIQCGFHVTMVPEALDQIPAILHWYRSQPAKVQHLSLIALSGMPLNEGFGYYVKGKEIPTEALVNSYSNPSDIGLTTDQLLECVLQTYPDYRPAAYISGGARIDVNKQLFVVSVCSPRSFFGTMGARSMELTQAYARLFMGRYFSFAINPAIGKKVFFMALFDKSMRSTGRNYLAHLWKHPLHIADKIYLQSMIIQQPIDFTDGIKNTCDHCVNPMIYQDRLINPCELDAYRGYGGLIESHKKA